VLHFTVHARNSSSGEQAEKHFFAKIYRDEKGEEVYQVLCSLMFGKAETTERFSVAKPVGYFPELRVLIQEAATGTSFQQLLVESNDLDAVSSARKVARALAAFHLNSVPTSRTHRIPDEASVIEARGRTLKWSSPALREEIDQVVKTVVSRLEEVPLRPSHLDLKTDHVLFDNDRYTLLDFDSFALSDPVLDAAHLLAQIRGLRFRFSVSLERLQEAAEAFKEEYFAHVPGDWRHRLSHNYAGATLKVAVGFFRRQEPQWQSTVASLIAEARASISHGER
jgi:hypothetical protein